MNSIESQEQLCTEEIERALEIKHAVRQVIKNQKQQPPTEGEDGTPPVLLRELTDYEYAQYALTTKVNLEEAMRRIRGMQAFREEYNIEDTVEEAMEMLAGFARVNPWWIVSLEYSANGHFIVVYDYQKLNPEAIMKSPESWKSFVCGYYYFLQTINSNFVACRNGVVNVCECQGMGVKNFNRPFLRKMFDHLLFYYPAILNESFWLNTPLEANLQYSFLKACMNALGNKIRLGCSYSGYEGRVDSLFKMPTEECAYVRFMDRCLLYFSARKQGEASFRLPESMETAPRG